jgi:hypothetical protein
MAGHISGIAVGRSHGSYVESTGVLTLGDISHEVPGLSVVSAVPGQNQIILRGLSSTGGASMVGYYLDDVPIVAATNAGLPDSYGSNLPTTQTYTLIRPRTFGVDLRYEF